MSPKMQFLQKSQFDKVSDSKLEWLQKLPLLAKMCRLNTLFEVKRAGSGHLGSSFSAMDIAIYLYHHRMNLKKVGPDSPDRDIYFSSKGHDVPGLYAVLHSLGIVPEEKFLKLRRLGGLDGHPDVKIPGIEANTGSLGMGISKARGMAFAKARAGRGGRVIVMTGDGEFQEGQNFEALQSTVQQKIHNITVVMDHNKLQSDRFIDRIVSLGRIEEKYRSFGWHVVRVDGHDFAAIDRAFDECENVNDKPRFMICDTIKGRGVSFMEHPRALQDNGGYYRWHAGAPDDESYQRAYDELETSIRADFKMHGLGTPELYEPAAEVKTGSKVSDEVIAVSYGKTIYDLAEENDNFVVLDADLSLDCKLREFEDKYPKRFVECGIAEQDMVSMAAGIALQGYLPIVHSFANFLAARANEQIYNALTENRRIIFSCHFAGLIPAGPGKSHQSLRDISLFGAFPNCTIVQACNAEEIRQLTRWAVNDAKESCMMRVNIGPSPRKIDLPAGYKIGVGRGVNLTEGKEDVLISYGPVMLHEGLLAEEQLRGAGRSLKVINLPWLNRFDLEWLRESLQGCRRLFVLEDHSTTGGLGDRLTSFMESAGMLKDIRVKKFGVDQYPACGTPAEVLEFHRLDGASLARRIRETS